MDSPLMNPNIGALSGSRIPGYAGLRRRDSLDASVGTSQAGQIPSKVRLAFVNGRESLDELFERIDTDGNGKLDQRELVTELLDMELGLSREECKGIHEILAEGTEFVTREAWHAFVGGARGAEDMVANDRHQPGARIPGYSGQRRRKSLDTSIGTSAFGRVS